MKVKKTTNLGLGLPLSGLLPAGVACLLSTWLGKLFMGCMNTPRWGCGWVFLWLLPSGEWLLHKNK